MSAWSSQVSEVAEEVIGSIEVGGVWQIACVESNNTDVHNKFQILREDSE